MSAERPELAVGAMLEAGLVRLVERARSVLGATALAVAPLYVAGLSLVWVVGSPSDAVEATGSAGRVFGAALAVALAGYGCCWGQAAAVHALVSAQPLSLVEALRRSVDDVPAVATALTRRWVVTVVAGVVTLGLAVPWVRSATTGAAVVAVRGPQRGEAVLRRRAPWALVGAGVLAGVLGALTAVNAILGLELVVRQVARVDGPRLELLAPEPVVGLVAAVLGLGVAEAVRLSVVTAVVEAVRAEGEVAAGEVV